MTGKGLHTSQAIVIFYVQALEFPSSDPAGGSVSLVVVIKMWHARARGKSDMVPKGEQVQPKHCDETEDMGCEAISEEGRDEVQSVC